MIQYYWLSQITITMVTPNYCFCLKDAEGKVGYFSNARILMDKLFP